MKDLEGAGGDSKRYEGFAWVGWEKKITWQAEFVLASALFIIRVFLFNIYNASLDYNTVYSLYRVFMLIDATTGPVDFDNIAISMMEEVATPYVVSYFKANVVLALVLCRAEFESPCHYRDCSWKLFIHFLWEFCLLLKKITLYIVSLDFNYFYLLIFWKSRVSKIYLKSCKFLFLIYISWPFNNSWLTDVPRFGPFHVGKIHSQFKKLTLAQISLDLANLVQKQSILIQIINNAAITLNQHKCKWVRTCKCF